MLHHEDLNKQNIYIFVMEASKIRTELTRQLGETETKITTTEKSLTELKEQYDVGL